MWGREGARLARGVLVSGATVAGGVGGFVGVLVAEGKREPLNICSHEAKRC